MKTCSRELKTSAWGEVSSSNRTTTLSTQPRHRRTGFSEWPSQSPDLNLIKHLWRDLKIAVQRPSPSNLTEIERICREEWEKLPKYRCAKLVVSYPRRLEAVNRCQRCFKEVLSKGSEYTVIIPFFIFNNFATKKMKNLLLPCHYGVLYVD